MGFLTKMLSPGGRTYTLSVVTLILGALYQADSQGLIALAPLIKIGVTMGLTITAPLIPIFLRKALPKDFQA